MNNFINQIREIQKNPSQISQMLYQSGKINQAQFEQLQGLKSPQQIGEYLLNNNIIQNNQLAQLQQTARGLGLIK